MTRSTPIEDYGLIGNLRTAALVSRSGSVDWLCLPRFDSGACFAALLGTPEHGRWLIEPTDAPRKVERCYRPDTLVLETTFETDRGAIRVVDFMPPGRDDTVLVRVVEGLEGRVEVCTELVLRFEYGSAVPWLPSDLAHNSAQTSNSAPLLAALLTLPSRLARCRSCLNRNDRPSPSRQSGRSRAQRNGNYALSWRSPARLVWIRKRSMSDPWLSSAYPLHR